MTVADYFTDKNVFITGGTGFLGKLIIEKLLRSCPGIGDIYVLLRPRKGFSIEERLEKTLASPVFNQLRYLNPDAFKKIIPIKGDVSELNLGLSKEDRELLINTVHIIYHSAASVRFDDFLKDAIILNVRGTREVAQLALDTKNISIFVHVSTTYCNCDKFYVEEKLYPPHMDWAAAINTAEQCDPQLLETVTQKYINPLPNTYTFAKSLGEHAVNDLCKGRIPTVIVRPSVVTGTLEEPIAGYTDNFNGPVGYCVAGGKGVLRTVYARGDSTLDYIPADYVTKGIILATQTEATKTSVLDNIEVYNISDCLINAIPMGNFIPVAIKLCETSPFSNVLWQPSVGITNNLYLFYIRVLVYQLITALLVDFVLKIIGQKPRLVLVQRKLFIVVLVLYPFCSNTFHFRNDKFINLQKKLKHEDSAFSFDYKPWTAEKKLEFFLLCKIGTEKYVIKDHIDMSKSEIKRRIMMYWLADRVFKILLFLFMLWIFIYKLNILSVASDRIVNYFNNL